jgi:hypothetical protein
LNGDWKFLVSQKYVTSSLTIIQHFKTNAASWSYALTDINSTLKTMGKYSNNFLDGGRTGVFFLFLLLTHDSEDKKEKDNVWCTKASFYQTMQLVTAVVPNVMHPPILYIKPSSGLRHLRITSSGPMKSLVRKS